MISLQLIHWNTSRLMWVRSTINMYCACLAERPFLHLSVYQSGSHTCMCQYPLFSFSFPLPCSIVLPPLPPCLPSFLLPLLPLSHAPSSLCPLSLMFHYPSSLSSSSLQCTSPVPSLLPLSSSRLLWTGRPSYSRQCETLRDCMHLSVCRWRDGLSQE